MTPDLNAWVMLAPVGIAAARYLGPWLGTLAVLTSPVLWPAWAWLAYCEGRHNAHAGEG